MIDPARAPSTSAHRIGLLLVIATQTGCRPGAPGLSSFLSRLGEGVAILWAVVAVVTLVAAVLAVFVLGKMAGAFGDAGTPTTVETFDGDGTLDDGVDVDVDVDRLRARAVVRAWGWSVALLLVYCGMLLVFSRGRYLQGSLVLVLAGGVPLGAMLFASISALRRGLWWLLAATLVPCAAWGALLTESWVTRELSELPGRIVQLSTKGGLACARLSTGQVSCFGFGSLGEGDDRRVDAPTLVRGLDDAQDVRVADHLACAIRRDGPPVCWGAGEGLPVPGDPTLPWELPGAADAVELVATRSQIVWRTEDGRVEGWPHAVPDDLGNVERLVVGGPPYRTWLCASGADVTCWESDSSEARALGVEAPTQMVVSEGGELCGLWSGEVRCFLLREPGAPRNVELPAVQELLDVNGICALDRGGRVSCWRGSRLPKVLLEDAERIIGAGGVVCAEEANERRCAELDGVTEYSVLTLLQTDTD